MQCLADQQQIANEVLTNLRTVRAYDQENREGNRYMAAAVRVYQIGLSLIFWGQLYGVLNSIVVYAATIGVYYYGADRVIGRALLIGDLVAFTCLVVPVHLDIRHMMYLNSLLIVNSGTAYASRVSSSVQGLSGMYTSLMTTIGSTQVLMSFLKMKAGVRGRRRVVCFDFLSSG